MTVLAASNTALVALVAALAAPLAGYWVAKRQRSGLVTTSEAETLWQEARDQRDWLKQQLDELRAEHLTCQSRLSKLEAEVIDLRRRVAS